MVRRAIASVSAIVLVPTEAGSVWVRNPVLALLIFLWVYVASEIDFWVSESAFVLPDLSFVTHSCSYITVVCMYSQLSSFA